MTIETVVRPFADPGVTPIPFSQPGAAGVPNVKVQAGAVGGSKTFPYSLSYSQSSYLIRVHKEKPNVDALLSGSGV